MTKEVKTLIPKYAYIPALIYILYLPVYFICKTLTSGLVHHDVSTSLDHMVPLVPAFIWIYVFAYFQWLVGYVLIARSEKDICDKFFGAEIIAKTITVIVFIIYPTIMTRPEITGGGATEDLLKLIYSIDSPTGLFPSLHCIESWIVARGVYKSQIKMPYKYAMWVFSLFVFASVVLVKQHCVVDILGGILVAELGIYLARKLNAGRAYDRLRR